MKELTDHNKSTFIDQVRDLMRGHGIPEMNMDAWYYWELDTKIGKLQIRVNPGLMQSDYTVWVWAKSPTKKQAKQYNLTPRGNLEIRGKTREDTLDQLTLFLEKILP